MPGRANQGHVIGGGKMIDMTHIGNLLDDLPTQLAEEEIRSLLARPGIRIERIVSTGQASAPGFWYDQDEDEFVLLLTGAAGLRFDGESDVRVMRAGDWLEIPAHTRHQVAWTSTTAPTVWLAVFINPQTKTAG